LLLARKRVGAGWDFPALGLGGTVLWMLCNGIVGRGDARSRVVLAGLVFLAGEVVASDRLANFGTGLYAMGLGVGALLSTPARGMAGQLMLPAGLVVLRLHGAIFMDQLPRLGLTEQPTLAAFLIAGGLAVWIEETVRVEPRAWMRVAVAGASALALPAATVLVMGPWAAPALLLGFAAVGAGFAAVRHGDRAATLALVAALGVVASFHTLMEWDSEERRDRMRVAAMMAAPALALAAIAEATRRRARKATS
jgi:hypothetical protein